MAYYLMVRRSSSRSFLGGYKVRKGVTKKQLAAAIRAQRRKGYSYSVVTETEFRKYRSKAKTRLDPRKKRKVVRHKARKRRATTTKKRVVRRKRR